jgi:hypothetical protein
VRQNPLGKSYRPAGGNVSTQMFIKGSGIDSRSPFVIESLRIFWTSLRAVVFVLGSKREECSGHIARSSLKSDLAVVIRVHFVCSPIPIGSTEDINGYRNILN